MINIYIKELDEFEKIEILDKFPKFLRKLLINITKIINSFFINKIDSNNKIYIIPDIERKKVYKNIIKKLKKEETKTQKVQVVLSKTIKEYKTYFESIKILDGKLVMKESVYEILSKVLGGNKIELQDVYILTNKYNNYANKIIKMLKEKVKSINIVTKEINKYNNLEEMLSKEGIIISVANNKRKSLKKAKIIINLDFTKEELKEYVICRNSVIINLTNEKIDNLKSFDGIIVQNVDIELKEIEKDWIINNNLKEKFNMVELYESTLSIANRNRQEIIISKLYGNNGKIHEKEIINWQKILTNEKK